MSASEHETITAVTALPTQASLAPSSTKTIIVRGSGHGFAVHLVAVCRSTTAGDVLRALGYANHRLLCNGQRKALRRTQRMWTLAKPGARFFVLRAGCGGRSRATRHGLRPVVVTLHAPPRAPRRSSPPH